MDAITLYVSLPYQIIAAIPSIAVLTALITMCIVFIWFCGFSPRAIRRAEEDE
jgi:hypothetical protein